RDRGGRRHPHQHWRRVQLRAHADAAADHPGLSPPATSPPHEPPTPPVTRPHQQPAPPEQPVPEDPDMAHNLADLFEHAVDAYGSDRLAVVEGERRLTFVGLEEEANRWCSALSDLGVGAGDHVAVHLRNGVDCLALILGILKLRAVPISINYRYSG